MDNTFRDHALVILKNDDYKDWKEGRAYAKFVDQKDSIGPKGNMKSSKLVFDIIRDIDIAKRENFYNSKRFVEEMMDVLKGWDYKHAYLFNTNEKAYHERRIRRYEEILNSDDPISYFSSSEKFDNGWWITYDDFWSAFTRSGCQSVFEHDDELTGVHVIGKCYHI